MLTKSPDGEPDAVSKCCGLKDLGRPGKGFKPFSGLNTNFDSKLLMISNRH